MENVIYEQKRRLRRALREKLATLSNEWIAETSQHIAERVVQLPDYRTAQVIMCYVSLPQEVQTRDLIARMKKDGKMVAIPWCDGPDLRLFLFERFHELLPGTLGILEPPLELRVVPERVVSLQQLQLVLVPGLGFDRRGGRLGRGKGYYDRFLRTLPPTTSKVALAFEWQLVDEIPMLPHDVRVDKIVTEQGVYQCQ